MKSQFTFHFECFKKNPTRKVLCTFHLKLRLKGTLIKGCLKKWLFVQDHCPMCSAKIIEEVPPVTSTTDVQQEPEVEQVEPSATPGQINEVKDEVFDIQQKIIKHTPSK